MARGFSQIEGIAYDETFASIARYTSIRSIMAIAIEIRVLFRVWINSYFLVQLKTEVSGTEFC